MCRMNSMEDQQAAHFAREGARSEATFINRGGHSVEAFLGASL